MCLPISGHRMSPFFFFFVSAYHFIKWQIYHVMLHSEKINFKNYEENSG